MLTRVTLVAAVLFAVVTVVLAGVWLAGGPQGNVVLGLGLAVFFTVYWAMSRARTSP